VKADELSRLLVNNEVQLNASSSAQPPGPIAIGLVRPSATTQGDEASASEGAWQLVATHHSGSLAAAVAAGRAQNLLLSFSTLLLLAASFVLVALLSRRAQRLAQQKMDFVTTISHELRTPLAVICSAGDNLAHGIVSQPEQTQQYGSVIRNEGQRLSAMVEQVLEFAGVQAGRKRYVSEPVDMRQVLERALAVCQLHFNLEEFVVERQIAPNLPLVLGDEVALRNVLQNLICNGMKYSQNERWLQVRATTAAGRHGPEVQISVEDRGIGIAPEDLPHIFEPFYRARDVVAAQIRGSGLGLALVQHTVAAHGGRISVTSQPGVGSTFTMHLPAMSEPAEAKEHDSGVKSYEPSHLTR
jgi:signal transduction histidine kinase